MKLNVLSDYHHSGLFNSLRLLFERRLGGVLYRPIGNDWLDLGYWRMAELYNNHPLTVAQYLGTDAAESSDENGLYICPDQAYEAKQNAITVERFMSEPIDIVIASIPQHVESFAKLAADHPNHPKLIYQIGNQWNISTTSPIKNILSSARLSTKPAGFNILEYHQEFDLDIFHPDQTHTDKLIRSFVNCFNTASIYQYDWMMFLEYEKLMSEWKFESLGGSCRDGNAGGEKEVARMMREAQFVWHVKYAGDGYGHVLHNAAAVGRPMIFNKSYYLGKMGGELMIDGITGIDICGLQMPAVVEKIEHFAQPSRWSVMSSNIRSRFEELVNFDEEEKRVMQFLDNLL